MNTKRQLTACAPAFTIYTLLLIYKTRSHIQVSVLWLVFILQQLLENVKDGYVQLRHRELSISDREHYFLPFLLSPPHRYTLQSNYLHVSAPTPGKSEMPSAVALFCPCIHLSPKPKLDGLISVVVNLHYKFIFPAG